MTDDIAPSIELMQGFEHLIGFAAGEVDRELGEKRPFAQWIVHKVLAVAISKRRRERLRERLTGDQRSAAEFARMNRYLFVKLRPTG